MHMLLSIVVPTKDREEYALSCVASLIPLVSAGAEIVIHDNSSGDALERKLRDAGFFDQVVYRRLPQAVDVIENCNRAVDLARGEYVTMIGDDDTVTPYIINATEIAKARDVDVVNARNLAHYYWPDLWQKHRGYAMAGRLKLKSFTGEWREESPRRGLERLLRGGGLGLVDSTDIPKLYYGIVRRSCLLRVKELSGSYFPGVSPDIAVATALGATVSRVWTVDFPVFLPGSGRRSTAGASARKEHVGRLQDQAHIPKDLSRWPTEIPFVFAVQTVWAASALMAIRAVRCNQWESSFNYEKFFAECYTFNPAVRPTVVESLKNYIKSPRGGTMAMPRLAYHVAELWLRRVGIALRRIAFGRWSKPLDLGEFPDVHAAVLGLVKHLDTHARLSEVFNPKVDEAVREGKS